MLSYLTLWTPIFLCLQAGLAIDSFLSFLFPFFQVNISRDIARDVSQVRVESFDQYGQLQPLPSTMEASLLGSTIDTRLLPKYVYVKFVVTSTDHAGSGPLLVLAIFFYFCL